jgi:hypothetical protein
MLATPPPPAPSGTAAVHRAAKAARRGREKARGTLCCRGQRRVPSLLQRDRRRAACQGFVAVGLALGSSRNQRNCRRARITGTAQSKPGVPPPLRSAQVARDKWSAGSYVDVTRFHRGLAVPRWPSGSR